MKNNRATTVKKIFYVAYFLLLLWVFYQAMMAYFRQKIEEGWVSISSGQNIHIINSWSNIINPWSNITILTWDISLTWESETWIVEIPESPRDYLNYLLEHWVAWTDYIIATPPKPPVIYSSNKEENNAIKDAYLARTKVTFTLPETDKQGYVLFVADREIPDNRDIFLAINGQSLWAIRKNKSLPVAEYGEYLYPMDKVVIAGGNGRARNLYDYVNNNELWLNAFVWEKGNYTKKIIIFFK